MQEKSLPKNSKWDDAVEAFLRIIFASLSKQMIDLFFGFFDSYFFLLEANNIQNIL